jgi:hypothetical protein
VKSSITSAGTMALKGERTDADHAVGSMSDSSKITSDTANTTLTWTPSVSAKDLAGNAMSTTTVTESGAPRQNFKPQRRRRDGHRANCGGTTSRRGC